MPQDWTGSDRRRTTCVQSKLVSTPAVSRYRLVEVPSTRFAVEFTDRHYTKDAELVPEANPVVQQQNRIVFVEYEVENRQ